MMVVLLCIFAVAIAVLGVYSFQLWIENCRLHHEVAQLLRVRREENSLNDAHVVVMERQLGELRQEHKKTKEEFEILHPIAERDRKENAEMRQILEKINGRAQELVKLTSDYEIPF